MSVSGTLISPFLTGVFPFRCCFHVRGLWLKVEPFYIMACHKQPQVSYFSSDFHNSFTILFSVKRRIKWHQITYINTFITNFLSISTPSFINRKTCRWKHSFTCISYMCSLYARVVWNAWIDSLVTRLNPIVALSILGTPYLHQIEHHTRAGVQETSIDYTRF